MSDLYTHSAPWNGHKGLPEEGITSRLSRQLADEQLAAYSQPSSWGLSQCQVLLLKGCIRHRCVVFGTDSQSLSLEVLITHYVPGKVLSTGGTGANQRIRQTCSRSCFLKGCIGGNQAKGWRWWEEGKSENSVPERRKRVRSLLSEGKEHDALWHTAAED